MACLFLFVLPSPLVWAIDNQKEIIFGTDCFYFQTDMFVTTVWRDMLKTLGVDLMIINV